MKNTKQNETEMNLIYFKLNIREDKMINVTKSKDSLVDCDMVIINSSYIEDSEDINPIIIECESILRKKFPSADWYYKLSNRGKHVFWKRESLLRQRQNQMEIPFNQAA